MIFTSKPSPLWNCLRCDKEIPEYEYDVNNGVCNSCPGFEPWRPEKKEDE